MWERTALACARPYTTLHDSTRVVGHLYTTLHDSTRVVGHLYLHLINGPILEVMQYEADPWTGLSKLIAPVLVGKIQVISLVPN